MKIVIADEMMDGKVNERMNNGMYEWMGKRTDRWMNEWTNERT